MLRPRDIITIHLNLLEHEQLPTNMSGIDIFKDIDGGDGHAGTQGFHLHL